MCCAKCHFISPNYRGSFENKVHASSESNKHDVKVHMTLVINEDVDVEDDDVEECTDNDDNRK